MIHVTFDPATRARVETSEATPCESDLAVHDYLRSMVTRMPVIAQMHYWSSNEAGQSESRFHNDYHEMVLVEDGAGVYEIGGKERFEIRTGDVVLLRPGIEHRYLPSTRFRAVSFHFQLPQLDDKEGADTGVRQLDTELLKFIADNYGTVAKVSLLGGGSVWETVKRLHHAMQAPGTGATLLQGAIFIELLVELSRSLMYHSHEKSRSTQTRHRDQTMAREIVEYIDHHLAEDLDTSVLCRNYHLHPNYCRNIFKEMTGQSITKYILTKRLQEARRVAEETGDAIKTIASRVGFRDYPYFLRAFKAKFGVSPSALRNSVQIARESL